VTGGLWPGPETPSGDIDYRRQTSLGSVKYVWEINRLQFLQSILKLGNANAMAQKPSFPGCYAATEGRNPYYSLRRLFVAAPKPATRPIWDGGRRCLLSRYRIPAMVPKPAPAIAGLS